MKQDHRQSNVQGARRRAPKLMGREIRAILVTCLVVVGASAGWAVFAVTSPVFGGAGRHGELVQATASACESMLVSEELSQLRRHLSRVGLLEHVESCSVRLSDGTVIAHSNPAGMTLEPLPASWVGTVETPSETRIPGEGVVRFVTPIEITGKGSATLEMTVRPHGVAITDPALLGGELVILLIGSGGVLTIIARARGRARGLGAVSGSLLEFGSGQRSRSALLVDERFGAEARAWSLVLDEIEQLRGERNDESLDRALDETGFRGGALGDAFDALWQGVLILDEGGHILYSNGAAGVLLQAKRDAMIGAPISSMVQDEGANKAVQSVLKSGSSGRQVVEVDRSGLDGESGGVLRMSLRSLKGEDGAEAIVVVEDVTQQRVADQARNAFVANATHELRTPLTNIRLYVEEAVDADGDDAIRAKALNVINSEARRLERIVSDMLSVSEIEAGSMALQESDVRTDALLDDLERDYAASSREKGIELKFDLPPKLPVLRGDRDKISMALHNLVGNAIKYTPAGGEVVVKVEDKDGVFRVEVRDNGIGISEDDCQRVFEKFYRAKDKRIKHVTGSGIGLSLAREVIRLHGGDISVESEVDEGSRFTMSLPAPAQAA